MATVKIPHTQLSERALQGIIEQYITRDGPDSGHVDMDFNAKAAHVKSLLDSGKAVILYDGDTQSCNILSQDEWRSINSRSRT